VVTEFTESSCLFEAVKFKLPEPRARPPYRQDCPRPPPPHRDPAGARELAGVTVYPTVMAAGPSPGGPGLALRRARAPLLTDSESIISGAARAPGPRPGLRVGLPESESDTQRVRCGWPGPPGPRAAAAAPGGLAALIRSGIESAGATAPASGCDS
jgi:hypothetical protein